MQMAECDAQHVVGASAATHVGVGPVGAPVNKRATQRIPPAIRREVLRRDAHRCVVPGCRNAVFVDVHHIHARCEGGDHDSDSLITLCGSHHRAVHQGAISITGSVGASLDVRHADGTRYGGEVRPAAAGVAVKLFGALRGLGFRETETRRALAQIEPHVRAGEPIEALLKRALWVLTEKRTVAA